MRNVLLKTLPLALLLGVTNLQAYEPDDGVFVGVAGGLIHLGDETLEVKHNQLTTKYNKVTTSNYDFKVGYQHFKGNRVELYVRNSDMDIKNKDMSTKTVGINYEWGFSSLATENFLPYVSVGFGFGEVSSKDIKSVDKVNVGEGTFGLGGHYQITDHVDAQFSYVHINRGFGDLDKKEDDLSSINQNSVLIGINYTF